MQWISNNTETLQFGIERPKCLGHFSFRFIKFRGLGYTLAWFRYLISLVWPQHHLVIHSIVESFFISFQGLTNSNSTIATNILAHILDEMLVTSVLDINIEQNSESTQNAFSFSRDWKTFSKMYQCTLLQQYESYHSPYLLQHLVSLPLVFIFTILVDVWLVCHDGFNWHLPNDPKKLSFFLCMCFYIVSCILFLCFIITLRNTLLPSTCWLFTLKIVYFIKTKVLTFTIILWWLTLFASSTEILIFSSVTRCSLQWISESCILHTYEIFLKSMVLGLGVHSCLNMR